LNRLAINANDAAAKLAEAGITVQADKDIIDAEVVEEEKE
jgi:hypothetical protein